MGDHKNSNTDHSTAAVLSADTTLGIIAGLASVVNLNNSNDTGNYTKLYDNSAAEPISQQIHCAKGVAGILKDSKGSTKTKSRTKTMEANNWLWPQTQDGKNSLQQQRAVIQRIQEQNLIIKHELSIEAREAKQMLSKEKLEQLNYLRNTYISYQVKIEKMKKKINTLDKTNETKQQLLQRYRQSGQKKSFGVASIDPQLYSNITSPSAELNLLDTPNSELRASSRSITLENSASAIRRLQALENRLELCLVKKNEQDSINKVLRQQIEKHRKDRICFDGIYKKIEKEIFEYQNRYNTCAEELQKILTSKDAVQREISSIKNCANSEQLIYEETFKLYRAEIEASILEIESKGISSSLSIALGASDLASSPKRSNYQLAVTKKSSKKQDNTQAMHMANSPKIFSSKDDGNSKLITSKQDSALNHITAISAWKIGYDKALLSTNDSVIAKYDTAFGEIQQITGLSDVYQIALEISRRNDENFKRFKHVEELHKEEVDLKSLVEQVAFEIDDFKNKEGIATGTTQKQQCRALESALSKIFDQIKVYDTENEEMVALFSRIKSSIHSIYSMLLHANSGLSVLDGRRKQGDRVSLTNLDANTGQDITDTNILEYLRVIESLVTNLKKCQHEEATSLSNKSKNNVYESNLKDDDEAKHNNIPEVAKNVCQSVSPFTPVGHGPATLSCDPKHKVKVYTPTFDIRNGSVQLPLLHIGGSPVSENTTKNDSLRKKSQIVNSETHGTRSGSAIQGIENFSGKVPTKLKVCQLDNVDEEVRALTYCELHEATEALLGPSKN